MSASSSPPEPDAPGTTSGTHRTLAGPSGLSSMADHWGLLLAYGLITMGIGLVLALWPEETLVVVAVIIAIQLIFSGAFRIVSAVASRSLDGGMRAMIGLSGALAVLIGLLCLRSPLQTLAAIGMLIGIYWVFSGLVDLINAISSDHGSRRLWDAVLGLVSLGAGVFLVVNPTISLAALVIVACVWLFGYGFFAVVAALMLRSSSRSTPAATLETSSSA